MGAYESPIQEVIIAGPSPLPVTFQGPTTAAVVEVAVPLAGTEQSYALPSNARSFTAKLKEGRLDIGYASSGPYLPVSPGSAISSRDLGPGLSMTIYFKSSKPSDVLYLEIFSS